MNSLNTVMLIGRLGKDPELHYSQKGTAILNMSIATDESYTDPQGERQQRTEWHTVVCFQRTAENCAQYLSKGNLVYVEGSLATRKWEAEDGTNRYSTEVSARTVKFLDRKAEGKQSTPDSQAKAEPARAQRRVSRRASSTMPTESVAMDDIPF
ncbi:hypothetical protein Bwad005_08720 [Bilophila wadsworthia]